MSEQKPGGNQPDEDTKHRRTLLALLTGMPQASSAVQCRGSGRPLFPRCPSSTQGTAQLQPYAPGPAPITCSVACKEDEETT